MDDFDFLFQTSFDKSVMGDLITIWYIHNNENVVFMGPLCSGKTYLSIALRMCAIRTDIQVYYTSAMKLVQTLKRD